MGGASTEAILERVESLIKLVQESPVPFPLNLYWNELEPKLQRALREKREREYAEQKLALECAPDRALGEREAASIRERTRTEVLHLNQALDSARSALFNNGPFGANSHALQRRLYRPVRTSGP